MSSWVEIVIGGVVLIVLALIVRIFFSINTLNNSIAKLGFVIREDAKKYFDDAADTITETNESFRQQSVTVITESAKKALLESATITEHIVAKAHQEAGQIVLEARNDARKIIEAAHTDADKSVTRAIEHSSTAIRWVLEQYVGTKFTTEQHEAIIRKLIDDYINEDRP